MERHYYIRAVEEDWDYAPSGRNLALADSEKTAEEVVIGEVKLNFSMSSTSKSQLCEFDVILQEYLIDANLELNIQKIFVPERIENRKDRIGSIYKKAIFRGYTDETFSQPVPVPEWAGILGPLIKAEVGDTVFIHFQNRASGSNFSIHPHGFLYDKANEGALYVDGTSGSAKAGDAVPPGGEVTYVWFADQIHAPTPQDDNCVTWGYHSHTHAPIDIDTGLVGLAVFCRKGILDHDGNRLDVDKELYFYSDTANENNNWYFDENLRRCGDPMACQQLKLQSDCCLNDNFHDLGIDISPVPIFGEPKAATHFIVVCKLHDALGDTTNSSRTWSMRFQQTNSNSWTDHHKKTMTGDAGFRASNTKYHVNGFIYGNLEFPVCEGERVVWYFMSLNLGVHTIHANGQTMIIEKQREVDKFLQRGKQRIGSVYKKAKYYEYTDETFTVRKPLIERELHYGLAGPPIKAECGERVIVVVLNRASRPYSFLANGVSVTKENEGASYKNSRNDDQESGSIVLPGNVRVYEFEVPRQFSPAPLNRDCITYVYHSSVDLSKDIHSGLFGPLLVCKPGTISRYRNQIDVDREFFLNWMVIDENLSWYIDENINDFAEEPMTVNKRDGQFQLSNRIRVSAINGHSFGTLRGLNMCLGDRVSWHMYGFGAGFDHHHFSFEGNNFLHDGQRVDTASVFPGYGQTVTMIPDQEGKTTPNLFDGVISLEVIIPGWCALRRNEKSGVGTLSLGKRQRKKRKGVKSEGCIRGMNRRLLLRTSQINYESEGMFAWYDVMDCRGNYRQRFPPPRNLPKFRGVVRRYYIGVVEDDWDYCPEKIDPINGESLLNPNISAYVYVRDDPMFVGSVYKKALYREFTDESFLDIKPRKDDEKHLALLGPFIRGNVGDTIEIVFKNMASFPYNIVPRNIVFEDGSPITSALPTNPGQTRIYRYFIPKRSGPLPRQPNCVGSIYSSRVNPVADTYSGLLGPLVICKPGVLDLSGRRTDEVTKEFSTAFVIIDENKSNYRDTNFARAPARQNTMAGDFVRSNTYNTINGFIFGNLKGLVFREGERSAWYIFGMGSFLNIHTVHFHGQLYLRTASLTLRRDVLEIWAGTYQTVEMLGYNPGTWLYHCHVNLHSVAGMETTFTVLPKTK
ncbi:hephaestin-like protein [Mercenaria mercenaria]|uniref:hephaestin-like protein n=1 Tax=Mercenaria mercenaria TaxID=6596 RepID=UPI00234EA3B6|nr:hephaestin-like protein [Mercenaria mercenaria]